MKKLKKKPSLGVILIVIGVTTAPLVGSIGFVKYPPYEKQLWESNFRGDNDTTPPVTTIKFYGEEGENSWYLNYVRVELLATDDMSGVNKTYYRIDGKEWNLYVDRFVIQDDGIHLIEFYSVDNAGNVEEIKSAELKIDQKPPYIFIEIEKIKKDIWKCTAICFENVSGIDRVEFYGNYHLIFTDYDKPYEWIWDNTEFNLTNIIAYDKAGHWCEPSWNITPTRVFGIICNRELTEYSVSFYALIVLSNKEEPIMFKNLTFNLIAHSGYIGRYLIHASFPYDWPFS